jgi:hypothetical protein
MRACGDRGVTMKRRYGSAFLLFVLDGEDS